MTINDVNNGANIAPPVIQPRLLQKPEVTAPSKGGDVRDSAEAMSKAADQQKNQSLKKLQKWLQKFGKQLLQSMKL